MALAAPQCLDGLRLGLPEEWESHPTTSGRDELIRALAVTSGWDGEEQKTVRATPVRFNGALLCGVSLCPTAIAYSKKLRSSKHE